MIPYIALHITGKPSVYVILGHKQIQVILYGTDIQRLSIAITDINFPYVEWNVAIIIRSIYIVI